MNLECVTLKTTHKLIGEELSDEGAAAAAADSTLGPPGSTAAMGIVRIPFLLVKTLQCRSGTIAKRFAIQEWLCQ
jgi:hypothetical protein